jgi:hypothetical protein
MFFLLKGGFLSSENYTRAVFMLKTFSLFNRQKQLHTKDNYSEHLKSSLNE